MTDEVGTTPAFATIPDVAPPGRFECTKCGGEEVSVDLTRPSIDPRYALGVCNVCTPMRKAKAKGQDVSRRATAVLRAIG